MRIHALADYPVVHDDVREILESVGGRIDTDAWFARTEPVEREHVSGFIPFTDGGWDHVITFGLYSSASHDVPRIAEILERDREQMESAFRSEFDVSDDEDVSLYDDWDTFQMDWEQSDSPAWFVKLRALLYLPGNHRNQSGEPEYLFCAGVCDDLDYGRDSVGAWAGNIGTHWFWERNVPVSGLTPTVLAEIETAMFDAWMAL